MTADQHRVNVYALANAAAVAEAESQIGDCVRAALGVTDRVLYAIKASPTSGWLSFADRSLLWRQDRAPMLPDAAGARETAERFLQRLAVNLAARRDLPDGISASRLIPAMRPVELSLLPRLDGVGGDHWLYRAQPFLPLGGSLGSADVLGTYVEVRVGDAGRVVSFTSLWRPLTGERITAPWVSFTAPQGRQMGQPGEHRDEPPHRTVYVLGGDGVPQYYLAPYHLVDTGHTLALMSASPWSLTIEFVVQPDPNSGMATVTAIADGGSGDYAFAWARHPMDRAGEEVELHELGAGDTRVLYGEDGRRYRGSSVTVPAGAHLVLLLVKDERTGAFLSGQHMVCTGPALPADRLVS